MVDDMRTTRRPTAILAIHSVVRHVEIGDRKQDKGRGLLYEVVV
jgi:hypothetical protein